MNTIKAFNKKIHELCACLPNNEVLEIITTYKDKKHKDYYSALEHLGSNIGFYFVSSPLFDRDKNSMSYIPCFVYKKQNPFNKEPQTIPLLDEDSAFTNAEDCYSFLAKKYIYQLMTLKNFSELVN